MTKTIQRAFSQPAGLLLSLALVALLTAFAPLERTLGANLRIVLLHGSWVWTGLAAFGLAGLSGLGGLLLRRPVWHGWSQALGRTGLVFWLTYLPMSLVVMQMNWGGLYLDEPRFRIPLAFAIAGLLLQAGLALVSLPWVTSAANLVFGATLWASLQSTQNILHPDSPVAQSGSLHIQLFFTILLLLCLLVGAQVAWWWKQRSSRQP